MQSSSFAMVTDKPRIALNCSSVIAILIIAAQQSAVFLLAHDQPPPLLLAGLKTDRKALSARAIWRAV